MKISILLVVIFTIFYSCSVYKKKEIASKELTNEVNKIYNDSIFNGFAISIVNEKGILYENGFGFSDISTKQKYTENTIQNIASVSKTLVGVALLKAQELGKLNLNDPIEKYLPFKVINPKFPNEKITIHQLATHTSSISDNEFYLSKNYYLKPNQDLSNVKLNFDDEQVFNPSNSIISMDLFLENILSENGKWNKSSFSENKPGTMYEYSNIGTVLSAFIIEQATGETFQDFTKKYILKPLKMNNSGWDFEEIQFSKFSRLYENHKTPLPYYRVCCQNK